MKYEVNIASRQRIVLCGMQFSFTQNPWLCGITIFELKGIIWIFIFGLLISQTTINNQLKKIINETTITKNDKIIVFKA